MILKFLFYQTQCVGVLSFVPLISSVFGVRFGLSFLNVFSTYIRPSYYTVYEHFKTKGHSGLKKKDVNLKFS